MEKGITSGVPEGCHVCVELIVHIRDLQLATHYVLTQLLLSGYAKLCFWGGVWEWDWVEGDRVSVLLGG
jgi:hypothetical protein